MILSQQLLLEKICNMMVKKLPSPRESRLTGSDLNGIEASN